MADLFIGLAAAGPRTGLGHVVRTAAVLEALARQGFEVCLLVEERGAAFDSEHYSFDEDLLRIETCAKEEVFEAIGKIASCDRTSILMTDVPEAEEFEYSVARLQGCQYAVCLNAHYPDVSKADLTFLRGYSWKPDEDLPVSIRTGAEFESVAEGVRNLRPSEPWSGDEVNTVLITLGTADPGRLTEDVAREAVPQFDKVDVVVGPLFDSVREVAFSKLDSLGVNIHFAPDNLSSIMLDAELVVSLGGQTAYEAMCLGRPVAGVRWGPVERALAFHVRNGLMFDLGKRENVGMRLSHARSSPELLQKIAATGWSCIDGKGAERMASEILTVCK